MKINKLFILAFGIAAVSATLAFKTIKKAVVSTNSSDNLSGKLFDQPVDYNYVKPCLDLFKKQGLKKGVTVTQSVEFSKVELQAWLDSLPAQTDYTSVRVSMGVYTREFLKHYNVKGADTLVNRLTVFLVPYYKDQPAVYKSGKRYAGHDGHGGYGGDQDTTTVPSFNLGNVHP